MPLNEGQFNTVMNKAISSSTKPYDLATYNCTNYALDVFNYVKTVPIEVSPMSVYIPEGYPSMGSATITIDKSPQTLFEKLKQMKQSGGSESANIKIDLTTSTRAPNGKHECK